MDKNQLKHQDDRPKVAPGIDPDDSFGEKATEAEVKNNQSTQVTRLTLDEYEE
ncbi:hypothetical protein ACFO3D_16720 [Virgibacillus kekensis]|uniref:DUF4025 domain-containing protein n=1 Tax=Virgibacillus kekensis TaxID=202261 RepID=A0ABV9DP90_9BACI